MPNVRIRGDCASFHGSSASWQIYSKSQLQKGSLMVASFSIFIEGIFDDSVENEIE
jgi:hypothetical protein